MATDDKGIEGVPTLFRPDDASEAEASDTGTHDDIIDDRLGPGPTGEELEPAPFEYSITSYGADYPIDGLVRRIENGDIYVPEFQRGYVWSLRRASRFIESLLLGLPVPGIFLSREEATNKLLVIDGSQRLRTLLYYYTGEFADSGRTFTLRGVQQKFEGLAFRRLPEEYRRKLDDSILHATVISQETPSEDDSSIYHVFERLNTGGTLLSPQEIRSAIYHGPFAVLLRDLNNDANWRAIFGPVNSRMRDQELILRFFAMRYSLDRYEKPFKVFLNKFMGRDRFFAAHSSDDLATAFTRTIELVRTAVGDRAFRPVRALNAAVYDSVMVALAQRLDAGPVTDIAALRQAYDSLLARKDFVSETVTATADIERIERRFRLASAAFEPIG